MQPSVIEMTHGLPARDLLHTMEISREGDRREGILLRQSRGWFQISGRGHEAIAALAPLLRSDDILFPFYRDRALVLARGMTSYELALAYLAKFDSPGAGRQMPGHFCNRAHNIFPVATPVALECLPAVGAAWGLKLAGTDAIALCTIGDGALRQGDYYEAIAFAAQERLPVVMVIEDNGYAISTPTARQNPYLLNVLSEESVIRVNGRDAYEVYAKGAEAVARARRGDGLTVLWCDVDRLSSHTSSDDHRIYRDAEDIARMMERDPVDMLAQRLIGAGELSDGEWAEMRQQVARQIEEEYRRAEAAPDPDPGSSADWHYGASDCTQALSLDLRDDDTMVRAINETLATALASDNRFILCGEDIEDPKGGVFGFTKGLSTRFPDRVYNAPLAESTIVGTAVGLAVAGYVPVFEIQFVDFLAAGFNELMNQAATLRWRSAGTWSCPLVLIAPCGAYLPAGGPWHSQTHEGMWAHLTGLRVVEPSTPEDAAGLLWTAIHGDDPVLFLVPKHMMRKRDNTGGRVEPIPFGKCAVRREGSDVTLVTWGNCVELAGEAADIAQREGVRVEILDIRTISPCDWDGIAASLAKTGRLVVLHEDSRTGGFGQAIVAEVVTRQPMWEMLFTAPRLVTRSDTHIAFAPVLEYGVLPTVTNVLSAIREVMK